jgi:GMP synthase (glutamine-hydrolysing)
VSVFEDKATGVREGNRVYGEIAALKVLSSKGRVYQPPIRDLMSLQAKILSENLSFSRVFYSISEKPKSEPYVVAVRAVQTEDYLTAKVADIPWKTLNQIAEDILAECTNVSAVYYDVTPKPPATIEME